MPKCVTMTLLLRKSGKWTEFHSTPSLALCDVNQPVAKSARSRAGVYFSLFKGSFMGSICLGPTFWWQPPKSAKIREGSDWDKYQQQANVIVGFGLGMVPSDHNYGVNQNWTSEDVNSKTAIILGLAIAAIAKVDGSRGGGISTTAIPNTLVVTLVMTTWGGEGRVI